MWQRCLELPSPNESIRGGPSTAEVMETDTDLLMPVPEESLLSGKVPRQCVRPVRARRTQPAGPGRNATDQEQCRSDDGGRAVVLGRRRGILREQSQSGGQTGSGGSVLTLGISPLLSSNKRQKGLNVTQVQTQLSTPST
ncbi:uncharacterized protein LOC6032484 isoform X2 [Culex quinquefasciatus]|uniref:uncharacterized protein LOC6032484 isoform X2 n=1 Tax=Culex quinquefasciatus TaxID=7176 RepID=UPI0018E3B8B3|nr:uncharacterized protein LOC6032484 isoform X2 [Culex quinquefasciatus]